MVLCQLRLVGPLLKSRWHTFITDDNTTKGRDLNINIINGIHKIKGRTSVNILVSNYTNKTPNLPQGRISWTFLNQPLQMIPQYIKQKHTKQNSLTLQKMMAEQVKPDVFNLPCHKLTTNIQNET